MRLDKYLKVSRLIKRRTVANDACDAGRVMINGKVAKASVDVKAGDIIEISFGNKNVKVRVTDVKDTVKKEEAKDKWVEQISLKAAIDRLSQREHRIIELRYFEGKTQMEVAQEIQISQAQVSRLEKRALKSMKNYLT